MQNEGSRQFIGLMLLNIALSFKKYGTAVCILRINKIAFYCSSEKGIKYLFPIQAKTFNYVYDGEDVIGQASKFSVFSIQYRYLINNIS